MPKGTNGDSPSWLPSWAPDTQTVGYIAEVLTAGLLILVLIYLVKHFYKGGNTTHAATVAAGVGVGGAGT
jgi:hypothetical protein